MTMIRTLILLVLASLAFSNAAMAHAIRFDVDKHPPAVKVQAYFSATSPLVDAMVQVYAPGGETPYQSGRTDRAGYFAFIPDESGEWTLEVDDERGHRNRTVINVTGGFFEGEPMKEEVEGVPVAMETPPQTTNEIPLVYRIIFGLALIFGLTGIFYGMRARQSQKTSRTRH